MKKLGALPLMLVLASVSLAQGTKPIAVWLANENADVKEPLNALSARLGASNRYALSSGNSANLWADLTCGRAIPGANAFDCYLEVTFRDLPSGLSQPLVQQIVLGDDAYIGEQLFQVFVRQTSDEKIEAARKQLKVGVQIYCSNAAHSDECHGVK